MTTFVSHLAARSPDDPMMVTSEGSWSTSELLARAGGASAWLDSLDAASGASVPAVLWGSREAITLVLGGALSHRPLAPLGPQLTIRELVACLSGMGAAVLVAEESTAQLAAEAAAAAGLRLAVMPAVFVSTSSLPLTAEPEDVFAILHTSGTSGVPKRVAMQQGRLGGRAMAAGSLMGLGPGDRYFTAKGIHHVGGLGLTLAALGAGAAVIPVRRFSVDAWTALAPLNPTHASTVPAMVETLLPLGLARLPSMRVLQYGGAPFRSETLAALLRREPGLDVVGFYGQTEGSPITCLTPDDHRLGATSRPDLLDSAGRPIAGVELRIADPDRLGVGEVWASADHFFVQGADGWLHTGDLGRIDDGYLRLSGRLGDRIVRGGENVHPLEVEQVISSHPGVAAVAVAAVPDDRLGETVGAWVVPRDPAKPPHEDDLRRHSRAQLAGFKVPSVWTFCSSLPTNANGKVVRRLLTGVEQTVVPPA